LACRFATLLEDRITSGSNKIGATSQQEPGANRKRVLVVEDNRDSAEMLCEVLGSYGCVTRLAYNGPAALDAARDFHPDLALIDINLPLMDGYELARSIRQMRGLGAIRLVALTGHSEPAHRRRAQEAGFDRHLVKPVDLDQLRSLLGD
jgi:CheY-like chemotaxis protein